MQEVALRATSFSLKYRWGDLPLIREESPDRKGHPAAESAGGGNFTSAVTENYSRKVMVKTRGKSSRRAAAMSHGYGTGTCKTKYTDRRGLPARCQGVGCEDKWQNKTETGLRLHLYFLFLIFCLNLKKSLVFFSSLRIAIFSLCLSLRLGKRPRTLFRNCFI